MTNRRDDPMGIEIRSMAPLFQVFDMPASVTFYRDVLGFTVVSTSPVRGTDDFDWALLRHGDIEIMLNTAYEQDSRPAMPEPSRFAGHNDAALYFGCPDVDAAFAHLQARGVISRAPKVAPYGMKQLYLKDPDGYEICLQWPAS